MSESIQKNLFIISRNKDLLFFVLSPLLALIIGMTYGGITSSYSATTAEYEKNVSTFIFWGHVFTMAHIGIVFFRSHANKSIFTQFPIRFTFIPLILFFSMLTSPYILAFVIILATWWDVYHSGLQTFGLARIYDSKQGNDPNVGRRMDYFFNLFLYMAPILAGVTFFNHVESDLLSWKVLNELLFYTGPNDNELHKMWRNKIIVVSILFLIGYIAYFWNLTKKGYKFPKMKLILYISTGVTSVIAWGFNPLGVAFFIMNFFHALQYFTIVYFFEKKNLISVFKLQNIKHNSLIVLGIIAVASFFFGYAGASEDYVTNVYMLAVYNVCSIMHFWYDGFIWSVRKKHV